MQSSVLQSARKAVDPLSIEQLELKGFSRSLAELQWLLVALVILYYVAPKAPIERPHLFVGATVLYAFTVLAHRYSGLFKQETRRRLAAETWMMVLFITWLLRQTGDSDSPLLNLYLLVLIMSGLTLGKTTTLLQLLLIVVLCVQTDYQALGAIPFSTASLGELMVKFAPFVLTTYLVTLLAADLQFSRGALQTVSQTDELTGLPNRRAFQETLRHEYARAIRDARVFSILIIDADGLKPTNDTYGHAAGDRLIHQIADALKDTLRGSDRYARYGGDEFVALLPDTDACHAFDAAERLRLCVANTSFDVGGSRVSSTVSIGVATYPADARDIERLVAVADRALYQAKSAGKNRIGSVPSAIPASNLSAISGAT